MWQLDLSFLRSSGCRRTRWYRLARVRSDFALAVNTGAYRTDGSVKGKWMPLVQVLFQLVCWLGVIHDGGVD